MEDMILPAFVYKITCNNLDVTECYIGSTYNFKSRFTAHKNSCNNIKNTKYNYKLYTFIRNNGGWSNWTMKVLYGVEIKDKLDLIKLERQTIKLVKPSLNIQIPLRTRAEYYADNKEKILNDTKRYREKHKDKLCNKTNCICGSSYTYLSRNTHFKSKKHNAYILENIENLKHITSSADFLNSQNTIP